jgi:hypothetical protein
MRLAMKLPCVAIFALALAMPALADGPAAPIALSLKDHRFTPSEIHVKANTMAVILLSNQDTTAEEFDSNALKVEKVIAGNAQGYVRIRPLAPGRYPFMGEYHSDTAQGVVISE